MLWLKLNLLLKGVPRPYDTIYIFFHSVLWTFQGCICYAISLLLWATRNPLYHTVLTWTTGDTEDVPGITVLSPLNPQRYPVTRQRWDATSTFITNFRTKWFCVNLKLMERVRIVLFCGIWAWLFGARMKQHQIWSNRKSVCMNSVNHWVLSVDVFLFVNTRYDNQRDVTKTCLRADPRLAPSQWETSLQSNAVSHWLGAIIESAPLSDGITRSFARKSVDTLMT